MALNSLDAVIQAAKTGTSGGKFTEFEKRLAEKGVICKDRLLHLPPSAEYAQIINTTEYTSVQADNKAQNHKKTSKKRLYKSEE